MIRAALLVIALAQPSPDELRCLLEGRPLTSIESRAATTGTTYPAPLLDELDRTALTPEERKARGIPDPRRRIRVDTMTGWDLMRGTIYPAVGLRVGHTADDRWLLHLHGGWERLGLGIVRRIRLWESVPSLGVSVGVAGFWDLGRGDPGASITLTIWRW